MTFQEFIEKTQTDEALKAKVDAAIMEKVILPMARAEGVELDEDALSAVSGGGNNWRSEIADRKGKIRR